MTTSPTEAHITAIVAAVEKDLHSQTKTAFQKGSREWKSKFPEEPGVYAIFEKNKLIYIGETADIKARMGDLRNTYNHTLRKKLGKRRFKGEIIGNKFSDAIERELDAYMNAHISIAFHPLTFGRTEVEAALVAMHTGLLNSESKRGKKK